MFNARELAVWLTALLKLLGHAVRLGGCLAINVVSFPAIKKQFPVGNCCAAALGFSWPAYGDSGFLDHDEAKREPDMGEGGERRQKYRRTNEESRSVWAQKQNPKKETCTVIQWETCGAGRITLVQYDNQSVTLDWGYNSWNIILYWQL